MKPSDRNRNITRSHLIILFVLCCIVASCSISPESISLTGSSSELVTGQPLGEGEALAFSYLHFEMLRPFELYVLDDANGIRSLSQNSFRADISPVWSPEGTQIVYTSARSASMRYFLVDADGTNHRELTTDEAFKSLPRWSQDGTRLAYIAFDPEADGSSAESPDLCITEVDTGITIRTSAGNIQDLMWMPGESVLLAITRTNDLVTAEEYDLEGNHLRRISELDSLRNAVFVSISPDASQIAHISPSEDASDESQDEYAVYITSLDGVITIAVGNFWIEGGVVWSPDSTHIAFVASTEDGEDALYVANADGSELHELMRVNTGDESGEIIPADPAWSPDGARLAIGSYANPDGSAIFVLNADGTDLRQITAVTDDGGMFYDLTWRP